MPYVQVYVSDEQFEQTLLISRAYHMKVSALLRPYVSGTIIQLWATYSDVCNRQNQQRIVKIAMEHQNTTIEEIVEWTGLSRVAVKTTLSEMMELQQVREHAGRGKVVNYFLQDASHAKSKKK